MRPHSPSAIRTRGRRGPRSPGRSSPTRTALSAQRSEDPQTRRCVRCGRTHATHNIPALHGKQDAANTEEASPADLRTRAARRRRASFFDWAANAPHGADGRKLTADGRERSEPVPPAGFEPAHPAVVAARCSVVGVSTPGRIRTCAPGVVAARCSGGGVGLAPPEAGALSPELRGLGVRGEV